MNITSDPNLWAICALTFLLGLLIGVFMTVGGRRKWKARYSDEVSRRETLERTHKEHEADWATREKDREAHLATREKEWREQDSLRGAAIKNPPPADRDLEEERRIEERRVAERRGDDPAI